MGSLYLPNLLHDSTLPVEVQTLPHLCDLHLDTLTLKRLAEEVRGRVFPPPFVPTHPRQQHKARLLKLLWDQVVQEGWLDVVDWEVYHVCHPLTPPGSHTNCFPCVVLPISRAARVEKVISQLITISLTLLILAFN